MDRVYVLNNAFECVSQTSLGRALTLVQERKAEVVRWSGKLINTATEIFRVPMIIRIFKYVKAFGRALKYTNRFVWERDDYYCQYCKKKITEKHDLTTDHVLPKSRGGKTIYENMVTCCRACNGRKDNKTCEEAKMRPIRKPFRPQMSRNMAKVVEAAKELLAENEALYTGGPASVARPEGY